MGEDKDKLKDRKNISNIFAIDNITMGEDKERKVEGRETLTTEKLEYAETVR